MLRRELPSSLGTAFTVAAARGAGVSRSRLRGADLASPFRGVRALVVDSAPAGPEPSAEERMAGLAAHYATRMLPGEFFCHVTAAVLWGLPLPGREVDPELLDVGVLSPHRPPRGRGVRGRDVRPHLVTLRRHPELGVLVASPASTWAQLASVLHDPYDLVAAGDAAVRIPQHHDDPPPLATIDELDRAVRAGRRVGVAASREALARVRTGASSRPETWTRLTLVDHGLPEPDLGVEVFDRRGGFIGRVDIAYTRFKIAVEYEGDHHFTDRGQWNRDILRYERLAAEGWTVIRVTREDLFVRPGFVVGRVRRALVAAGA